MDGGRRHGAYRQRDPAGCRESRLGGSRKWEGWAHLAPWVSFACPIKGTAVLSSGIRKLESIQGIPRNQACGGGRRKGKNKKQQTQEVGVPAPPSGDALAVQQPCVSQCLPALEELGDSQDSLGAGCSSFACSTRSVSCGLCWVAPGDPPGPTPSPSATAMAGPRPLQACTGQPGLGSHSSALLVEMPC